MVILNIHQCLTVWFQCITVPVNHSEDKSNDPPFHYTGGAKVHM